MKKITIAILFLVLFSLNIKAQKELIIKDTNFSKHSLNFEVFGKGFWFASVSYEYKIKPKFLLGAGLGFKGYLHGQSNRLHNGVSETGDYTDVSLFVPIYAMYKLGNKKHHLLMSAGNSFITLIYYNNYPSEKFTHTELLMSPFAGIGYEFEPGAYFYRVSFYAEYLGDNAWYPTIIPWLGLGVGKSF